MVLLTPSARAVARSAQVRAAIAITASLVLVGALLFSSRAVQQDDPYHLRVAMMLREGALINRFVWAKHTILAEHYADLHFGFHLWLVPFVTLLPPAVGGKVASIVTAGALLLLVWRLVGRSAYRLAPWVIAGLLLSSSTFLLRSVGMRPIGWGIVAMLLAVPLLRRRRYGWLAALSALFSCSYAAFPLLILPVAADALVERVTRRRWRVAGLAAVVGGVAAGLALHPYRAHLWPMLRVQWLGPGAWGAVGSMNLEWVAPGFASVVCDAGVVVLAVVISVVAAVRSGRLPPRSVLVWGVLAALSFALYLAYHRGIDYFVPAGILFCGSVARWLRPRPSRRVWISAAVLLLAVGGYNYVRALRVVDTLERIDSRAPAQWLVRNTPAGSEVFLPDYGAFGRLFFHNQHNVYTLALDPAFMRAHDPKLYDTYVDAIHLRRDPFEVISEVFAAPYVYVENTSHSRAFYEVLNRRPTQFQKVYQDSFAAVFETRPPVEQ